MQKIPLDRQVFKLPFSVKAQDIDDLNHVNNVVYVGWVQQAAQAHWLAAASEELRSQCMWVVLRHEIDYLHPAFEGDQLEALTWVDEPEGVRQCRYVVIRSCQDQKVLASAKSTWCLLDPLTAKPKRIPEEIKRS